MLVVLWLTYALTTGGTQVARANRTNTTTAVQPYVTRNAPVVKAQSQSVVAANVNNTHQSQIAALGEDPSQTVSDINTYIDQAQKMADLALKVMKILEIATKLVDTLSSVLGVIGPLASTIMSIVGMFIDKPESPELQAIKMLWKFIAEKFNELEEKIQGAVEELEAHNVVIDWQENVRDPIAQLQDQMKVFLNPYGTISQAMAEQMKATCKKHNPEEILTKVWNRVGHGCSVQGEPSTCILDVLALNGKCTPDALSTVISLVTAALTQPVTAEGICLQITWGDSAPRHLAVFEETAIKIGKFASKRLVSLQGYYFPKKAFELLKDVQEAEDSKSEPVILKDIVDKLDDTYSDWKHRALAWRSCYTSGNEMYIADSHSTITKCEEETGFYRNASSSAFGAKDFIFHIARMAKNDNCTADVKKKSKDWVSSLVAKYGKDSLKEVVESVFGFDKELHEIIRIVKEEWHFDNSGFTAVFVLHSGYGDNCDSGTRYTTQVSEFDVEIYYSQIKHEMFRAPKYNTYRVTFFL